MKNLRYSAVAAFLFVGLTACSADMSSEAYKPSPEIEESEATTGLEQAYDEYKPQDDEVVSNGKSSIRSQNADGFFSGKDMVGLGNKASQSNSRGLMSSSAALGKVPYDSTHLYLHHANAKFSVDDLRRATFAIEKSVAQYEGYVEKTELSSTIEHEERVDVSEDSTLVTTYYTMHNRFVLRVPPQHLDSLLRSFEPLIVFLNYRNIYVEDVTLKMMREELKAKRNKISGRRMEDVAASGGKLNDRIAAEEAILRKEVAADEAMLAKLELMNKIELSEVKLDVYQGESHMQRLEARPKRVEAYKPGFFQQAGKSIKRGWNGFLSLVVGLLEVWPLLLFFAVVGVVLRIVLKRSKKA